MDLFLDRDPRICAKSETSNLMRSTRRRVAASFNSCMNSAASFSEGLWSPGAVARRTRTNFTAPGCLAIGCVSALLSGLRVMQ